MSKSVTLIKTICFGLPNLYVEILTPNVIVLSDEYLGSD
jgi:hypothetical protein